jgi:tRNA dimethylallyltransferase
VGYSEFFDFFSGKISRLEAIEKIKQHTRNYAKRQITWFNKVKAMLTPEMVYKG